MIQKKADGWSKPKALDVKSYDDMAQGTYVGGHWPTDGKHLIISLSEDEDDGTWSKPKPVGKSINTDGDESGPFLATDGKTIYFSFDRDGGEGSNDIWI